MGPAMEVQTFEGVTFLGRRWWFRIIDTNNNEGLAAGQTYKTEGQRDKTAKRFGAALGCRVVPGRRR